LTRILREISCFENSSRSNNQQSLAIKMAEVRKKIRTPAVFDTSLSSMHSTQQLNAILSPLSSPGSVPPKEISSNNYYVSKSMFLPKSNSSLICSTFSGHLAHLEYQKDECEIELKNYFRIPENIPIMDFLFSVDSSSCIFTALMNGKVFSIDLESEKETFVGRHEKAAFKLNTLSDHKMLLSASWDGFVKLWDLRGSKITESTKLSHGQRIYGMDAGGNQILLATSNRQIYRWDIRHMKEPLFRCNSPLKSQVTCIRSLPNSIGFIAGCTSGKIAIEYRENNENISGFKFKAHTKPTSKSSTEKLSYSVNDIQFEPNRKNFASCGTDGKVIIWDHSKRRSVNSTRTFKYGVNSIDYSNDGNFICGTTNFCKFNCDSQQKKFERKVYGVFVHKLDSSAV